MSEETTAASAEETTAAAVTTETQEAAQVEIPAYYQALGVENDEQFNEKVSHYKTLEQNWNDIQTKQTEINQTYEVLRTVEREPNAELVVLENLINKGIPRRTANEIMDFDAEAAVANPLKTLMLAEEVGDPVNFAKYKDKIEKAFREEYNLPDEGEYTPSAKMEMAALKATERINKIKADVNESQNPYTFAKSKFSEERQKFEIGKKAAATELDSIVAGLTEVTDKQGDKVFKLKVTKEDTDMILQDKETIASIFKDAETKEGKAAIRSFVENRILIRKYQSGELFKEWEATYAADAKQAGVREALAGNARDVDRSGVETSSGVISPIMQQAIKDGLVKA